AIVAGSLQPRLARSRQSISAMVRAADVFKNSPTHLKALPHELGKPYHERMSNAAATLKPDLLAKRDQMLAILRDLGRVAVTFSGGIDSTVVAQAAYRALGDRAVAVTADSPSVARVEIEDARRLAAQIGIRHVVVRTEEFDDPDYVRNDGTRC